VDALRRCIAAMALVALLLAGTFGTVAASCTWSTVNWFNLKLAIATGTETEYALSDMAVAVGGAASWSQPAMAVENDEVTCDQADMMVGYLLEDLGENRSQLLYQQNFVINFDGSMAIVDCSSTPDCWGSTTADDEVSAAWSWARGVGLVAVAVCMAA